MNDIKAIDRQYVANTYARFPLEIAGGKGSVVWDESGKKYIDLGTGIAVNIFGIADEKWVSAVTEQLSKVQHTSNLYYSAPCARLAKTLCEKTGMKKVFFGNSGGEANECAIKIARKYHEEKYGVPGVIVTLKNSFHGRTLATLAATGQEAMHKSFLPLTPGFVYAEANDCAALCKLVEETPDIAAFIYELVQGEGGVLPLTQDFVSCMAKLAAEKDILLIADEVQTGNGRTGFLYAWMEYGVKPDVMSTAKGLGGGLPLGVCLMGDKVEGVLKSGDHGSTFGGNPIACAGALSILERLDAELLEGVKRRSDYINSELSPVPGILSITGLGLMLGLETIKPASEVIAECMEKGVLVIKAHDKVRLLPALNIPMDELKEAVWVIKEVCT